MHTYLTLHVAYSSLSSIHYALDITLCTAAMHRSAHRSQRRLAYLHGHGHLDSWTMRLSKFSLGRQDVLPTPIC